MALSLLKPNDASAKPGLAAVARNHFIGNGVIKNGNDDTSDADRGSPKSSVDSNESPYKSISPLNLFPTSMLARQMLGNLSLHATLAATPGAFASKWYQNPASPPPTPVTSSKKNNNNHVTSSTNVRKSRKRIKTSPAESTIVSSVNSLPEPPPSPPTSGSSPQSNGSAQDINLKIGQDKDKTFTCSACNRSFGYKHVLQNHERTHTGEKPFECKECHKRFTRDHHLKTHMRLHTGEKPYHCTHCDRQFVQVANLRRHLRVHTGERPYGCDLCSSKFSDSNQLKAHMLIHKGEKPFHCVSCNGRFRRRHHLLHHKCPMKRSDRYHSPEIENMDDIDEDSLDNGLEIDEELDGVKYSPANDYDPDYQTRTKSPDSPATPPPDNYLVSINNNRKLRERKSRDIRRVVRIPDHPVAPILDPATIPPLLPEQTEPEDLSMPKSKLRSQLTQNNNHDERMYRSRRSESPRSTISRSPSLEKDVLLTSLYQHPKFRRHIELTKGSTVS